MAQAETKYTPIGDEWIPSSEAVARLVRFHASRPEQLFKYDGDGVAEMQLAISCGFITCGLLVLPDQTQEEVGVSYLRYDPERLATGYDQERRAAIYLLCREVDNLTRESSDAGDERSAGPSPTAAAIPVSRSLATATNDYETRPFKKLDPLVQLCVQAMDDMGPGILDRGVPIKDRATRVNEELGKLNCPRRASDRTIGSAVAYRRQHPINK